jgi:biopolymer transport protein ExbD
MAAGIETKRISTRSEINVTPFVDVMLVLLIIFMVAAPLATVATKLDLSNTEPPLARALPPVFVSLQDNGTINVGTTESGETAADWSTLARTLEQKTGGDRSRQILLRADQKVPYAAVMRLADELDRRGYRNKTLVTEDIVD